VNKVFQLQIWAADDLLKCEVFSYVRKISPLNSVAQSKMEDLQFVPN